MDQQKLSEDLREIGRAAVAWSYAVASGSFKAEEIQRIFPSVLKRNAARLEEIAEECEAGNG